MSVPWSAETGTRRAGDGSTHPAMREAQGVGDRREEGTDSMRLLICDDEAIFVEAMASVFCARGHVVVETTDVSALVERARGEAFDVCLVDLFFSGCPSV